VKISGNNAGIDLLGLKLSLAIPSASAEGTTFGWITDYGSGGHWTCTCPEWFAVECECVGI
jgi:hypothetical protein